jgi:hypothetical protein
MRDGAYHVESDAVTGQPWEYEAGWNVTYLWDLMSEEGMTIEGGTPLEHYAIGPSVCASYPNTPGHRALCGANTLGARKVQSGITCKRCIKLARMHYRGEHEKQEKIDLLAMNADVKPFEGSDDLFAAKRRAKRRAKQGKPSQATLTITDAGGATITLPVGEPGDRWTVVNTGDTPLTVNGTYRSEFENQMLGKPYDPDPGLYMNKGTKDLVDDHFKQQRSYPQGMAEPAKGVVVSFFEDHRIHVDNMIPENQIIAVGGELVAEAAKELVRVLSETSTNTVRWSALI